MQPAGTAHESRWQGQQVRNVKLSKIKATVALLWSKTRAWEKPSGTHVMATGHHASRDAEQAATQWAFESITLQYICIAGLQGAWSARHRPATHCSCLDQYHETGYNKYTPPLPPDVRRSTSKVLKSTHLRKPPNTYTLHAVQTRGGLGSHTETCQHLPLASRQAPAKTDHP